MKEIRITKLTDQEIDQFIGLITLFEEVFEMDALERPSYTHLKNVLSKPGFMAFIATEGDKIVGGMTVYLMEQYYAVQQLAYIFDLAVLSSHQRQGIGSALIRYLKDDGREQGYQEIFVQADLADDYALDFYRSTKPDNEENVIHFTYTL